MTEYAKLITTVCVLLAATSLPAEQKPAPVPLAGALCEFRIPTDGRPILLPVRIGQKTYSFLLDTGATHTTFDEPLRELLGKPKNTMQVETADGKTHEMHVYFAPDAMLGAIDLRQGGEVYCVDLGDLKETLGLDIHGVIGMGLMRGYALQLDFDGGKVRFFRPDGRRHPEWGQAVPMNLLQGGVPFVIGTLLDKYRAPFLLDTGYADNGMLSRILFDRLQRAKAITTAEVTVARKSGENRQSQVGRVEAFSLGKHKTFTYSRLVFDKGQKASMLGLAFLSRHKVTFDFANSKLYLAKGGNFDKPDRSDMSGLHLLIKKGGGVFVHSVDASLPAHRAGLKPGDVLLEINAQPVGRYTLWQIRRLLRGGDGKKIEVVFTRAGKKLKASFKLKRQI